MSENPAGFNSYWPMEGDQTADQFSESGFYVSNPNVSYQQQHTTPVSFLVPNDNLAGGNMYGGYSDGPSMNTDFDNEPPLLEELGIEPSKILDRSLAVLNPFQSVPFDDVDLVGPVCYCLTLGGLLIVMGSKINFGYVYGLAVTSCLMMYFLLNLMTNTTAMTLTFVASVLGLPPDPAQVAQPVLVCTAHIHWDPEFCDVKLIQIMMLSAELKHILEETSLSFNKSGHKPDSNAVQLLLCGDFNSLPDSGVIEFLSTGRVSADHQDFKDLPYKSVLSKISDCDQSNEFTHSYKLASAYSEDIMPYTNYTFHFKGIIDYIFYSKQNMTPLGLLGPLAADWLRDNKVIGCPHPHIPSDHFPLLVELEMTPSLPSTSNGIISSRR
ncbi:unnamed protein product [Bemisia tabaci]|uniref:Endonuclease/exonuclease/phosphatase domain-containing protein n=1 Tax=Bemisia tabaci TaxID=7038 RepID=A0A9P0AJH1_BEMTA|nr:unnamed protein product [Bemisia tabaci]